MEVKNSDTSSFRPATSQTSAHFYRDVLGWQPTSSRERAEDAFPRGRLQFARWSYSSELLLIEVGPDAAALPRIDDGHVHFGLKSARPTRTVRMR